MTPAEKLTIATKQLNRLCDDLEAIADWRDDLTARLRRAHLRFEFCGLDPEEQEQLEAEAEAFKQVCRCLWRISRDSLPAVERRAAA